MGCKNSKEDIIEYKDELYNEYFTSSRRIMTGLSMRKGEGGVEGNIQIAVSCMRKRKYTQVGTSATQADISVAQVLPQSNDVDSEPLRIL